MGIISEGQINLLFKYKICLNLTNVCLWVCVDVKTWLKPKYILVSILLSLVNIFFYQLQKSSSLLVGLCVQCDKTSLCFWKLHVVEKQQNVMPWIFLKPQSLRFIISTFRCKCYNKILKSFSETISVQRLRTSKHNKNYISHVAVHIRVERSKSRRQTHAAINNKQLNKPNVNFACVELLLFSC